MGPNSLWEMIRRNLPTIPGSVAPNAPSPYMNLEQPDMTSMTPFEPRMGAFNQMQDMIGAMPQRDQNPSLMRRIGAGIVGFGAGIKPQAVVGGQPIGASFDVEASNLGTDQFLNRKYYNEMSDWGAKFKALDPLVRAEGDINQNNRILYDASLDRNLRTRTIERQEDRDAQLAKKENETLELNRVKEDRLRKVAEARTFRLQNPDWKPAVDKNGNLYYVNPINPTETVDTGIDQAAKLSDLEKINLGYNNAVRLEEIRQENRLDLAETRGEIQKEVKETPSASSTISREELPTQTRTRKVVRAEELKRSKPEYSKWINVKGNVVNITKPATPRSIFGVPAGTVSGPTQAQYDEIVKYVDAPPPKSSTTTRTTTAPKTELNIAGSDKVTVRRKSDGREGEMSRSAYEALKDKYELVK